MTSPNELGAAEAARAIRDKRLTAEALVRACLDRIGQRESVVGAWTHLDGEAALAAARRVDRGEVTGPLAGVPIAVKDLIDTSDMPTGYGSPIYANHRPGWDAACVALARRAGGIVLGKTVTTEFAAFFPGKTAHPLNPKHTPGGSSSGSAAAVADHMAAIAFGTQTAASVTRPSSYCGVVGAKPTFGAYSLAGIKAFATSFDTLGTITRNVADAQLMRAVLLGAPDVPAAPSPTAGGSLRIGLCRTPWWAEAQPATHEAVEAAASRFARGGHKVTEVSLPPEFDRLVDTHKEIMAFEAARNLADEHARHADRLSPQLRAILDSGAAMPFAAYRAATERAVAARQKMKSVFSGLDCLLAPSAPGEAPVGLGATGDPIYSRMWTLLYVPSVTLPGHVGPQGLPVGVQIIAPRGEDDRMLAMAAQLEPVVKG